MGGDHLSPREREVLSLLVAGLASKEVAWEMGVSIETVLWYAKRIYKALGVHNRAAAVRIAIERGLVAQRRDVSAAVRPLIGRTELLAKLDAILGKDRLVSLVGMGGVGKTSIALAVAYGRRDRHADGVVDVRLDPVEDERGLVTALADALDVSRKQLDADPWAALARHCRDQDRLLVLDNFEQLTPHAARLHALLAAAPRLTLLVTSRLPLGVPGETLVRVEGMVDAEAVALFVDEVRRRAPERTLAAPELAAIGEICRQLGGMPLAILLAACWAEVLPIAQIVAQVADRPELLASDGLVPVRHRRLDQVIDATIALRGAEERAALARMAVFADGFDRDAALQVTGSTIETLGALIRSSLLSYDATADRYRMHPLVEERARAEAKRTDAWDDTRRAHLAHFAAIVGDGRRLDVEQANVRRAWSTAVERGDAAAILVMLEPLVVWCDLRTRLSEGMAMIREALASPAGQPHDGYLRLLHDWLAIQGGGEVTPLSADVPAAHAFVGGIIAAFLDMSVHGRFAEAFERLTALEAHVTRPAYWEARRVTLLALLLSGGGHTAEALAMQERMLASSLAAGELSGAHLAVHIVGVLAGRLGEVERISRVLEIGEQLMERLADEQTAALAQIWRAILPLWRGELDAAFAFLDEVDALARTDNAAIRAVTRGVEALLVGVKGRRVQAEAARAAIEVGGIGGMFPEALVWAEWGVALACAAGRDWDAARTHHVQMAALEAEPWCTFPEHVTLGHVIEALRLDAIGDAEGARRARVAARASQSRAHAMYEAFIAGAGVAP